MPTLIVNLGGKSFFRDIQEQASTDEQCGYLYGVSSVDHIAIDGGYVLRNSADDTYAHFALTGREVLQHIDKSPMPRDSFIGVFHTHPDALVEEDVLPSYNDILGVPETMKHNPNYIYAPATDLLSVFVVATNRVLVYSNVAEPGLPVLEVNAGLPNYN